MTVKKYPVAEGIRTGSIPAVHMLSTIGPFGNYLTKRLFPGNSVQLFYLTNKRQISAAFFIAFPYL